AHLFDAATGALIRTFDDPTVTGSDNFGGAVDLAGNLVLIGAPGDSTAGFLSGQAHLFDASTGALLHTFTDPTGTGDRFGLAVAVDGNQVLIGDPADGTVFFQVGQAHVFDATTFVLIRTLVDPTPTTVDFFGSAVDLQDNQALVGAQNDSTLINQGGQAYLFDATTGALIQTYDDPTPDDFANFGRAVAIDGNEVLIGADFDGSGEAHLFNASTGALLETFSDPTPTMGDQFGIAVALLEGDRVLIGAALDDTEGSNVGQAHVFDSSDGSLMQTIDHPSPTTIDTFSVAVAMDAERLVIGAENDDDAGTNVGRVYTFLEPSLVPIPLPGALGLAVLLAAAGLRAVRAARP
ncbi:MAG: WD40 repeat domain-containing protein, partial [Myxococcota bacterium]